MRNQKKTPKTEGVEVFDGTTHKNGTRDSLGKAKRQLGGVHKAGNGQRKLTLRERDPAK